MLDEVAGLLDINERPLRSHKARVPMLQTAYLAHNSQEAVSEVDKQPRMLVRAKRSLMVAARTVNTIKRGAQARERIGQYLARDSGRLNSINEFAIAQ